MSFGNVLPYCQWMICIAHYFIIKLKDQELNTSEINYIQNILRINTVVGWLKKRIIILILTSLIALNGWSILGLELFAFLSSEKTVNYNFLDFSMIRTVQVDVKTKNWTPIV